MDVLVAPVVPMADRSLPALSTNRSWRYFNFVALYFAQGIPEGMTYFGIPAWMAMHGKSPGEIGAFLGVVGLPWSFKLIVAPLMDRYTYLAMGRRRPWVLFGQLGLIASFIAMSLIPDPLQHLSLLMVAAFWVSFFGAFQDVATDGMAIDIIPIHEQARANGFMWGSKTVGISASLATGIWIINHHSFMAAILALSVGVSLVMLVPLFLRERPGEKLVPWAPGQEAPEAANEQVHTWGALFKSLFKVLLLPSSLAMAFAYFFFIVGVGFMGAFFPVFSIKELGLTDQNYSNLHSIVNLAAGLLGMAAAGFLADFFGKRRMITVYLLIVFGLIITVYLLKPYWHEPRFIVLFMSFYFVLEVFIRISAFAILMELCWSRVAASQFTFYMAFSNFGMAFGSALLGPLSAHFSSANQLLFFGMCAVFTLALVQTLRMQKHLASIEKLEEEWAEK